MAKTIRTHTSTGYQPFWNVDFINGYLRKEHIYVYLDSEPYTNQLDYNWSGDYTIELINIPPAGQKFHIRRVVPRDNAINDYTDGAILKEKNLDDSYDQALMIVEEIEDGYFTPDESLNTLIAAAQGASYIQEALPDTTHLVNGARWYKPSDATTYVNFEDDTSRQWVEDNPTASNTGDNVLATTAQLEDKGSDVNTLSKYYSTYVINSDTGETVRATGQLDVDSWVSMDGSLAHQPV